MKVLLWSSKSLRNIESALKEAGYSVSYVNVGYSTKVVRLQFASK